MVGALRVNTSIVGEKNFTILNVLFFKTHFSHIRKHRIV